MMYQTSTESGERLWCCGVCEFKTRKTTNIEDHIEAKHLLTRIQCNLCTLDFTTSSYLKKHMKKVHSFYGV